MILLMRTPVVPPHTYATDRAKRDAADRGLTLINADWRAMFLAITDTLTDDLVAPAHVTATFRGRTRESERWAISWKEIGFDVIYNPDMAVIVKLIDGAAPVERAAPRQTQPPELARAVA